MTVNATFMLGVAGNAVALDERSGRELWHAGASYAMLPFGEDVVLGQPGGRVARLDARTGAKAWSVTVCPASQYATAFAASASAMAT